MNSGRKLSWWVGDYFHGYWVDWVDWVDWADADQ